MIFTVSLRSLYGHIRIKRPYIKMNKTSRRAYAYSKYTMRTRSSYPDPLYIARCYIKNNVASVNKMNRKN